MNPYPALDRELREACDAVRAAGTVIMEHFGGGGRVVYKSPEQPLTAADLAADAVIRERLRRAFPDDGWLSEETADSPDRLARSRVWVVDPIDGTNAFVAGTPEFVVSIGLVEGGRAVLGVLLNPATGELFRAVRGQGAFLGDRPIRVAARPDPPEVPGMLASRTELERGDLDPYRAGWRLMAMGSTAYRMAKVAEGAAHAYVSSRSKNEWDVCAAAVLIAEAGGVALQRDGRLLTFNRPAPVVRGILAAGSPEGLLPPPAEPTNG